MNSTNTKLTKNALFIHSVATVTRSMLEDAQSMRQKDPSLFIMAHVAETHDVELRARKMFGGSSIEVLKVHNLLNKHTLLVHGGNLSDHDKELVKQSGATIVHCRSSNIAVGDGTADICELIRRWNIPVCIATDGYVTSGTMDVLDEARKCYEHMCLTSSNEACLSPQEMLDMITVNAAQALGLGCLVGSIEQGKRADLVLVKPLEGEQNLTNSLFRGDYEIYGVVVSGKLLVHNNKLMVGDEQKILTDYAHAVATVRTQITTQ
jgi:5-methylthioadenosine/S-adenosylhomocysteine deaminase